MSRQGSLSLFDAVTWKNKPVPNAASRVSRIAKRARPAAKSWLPAIKQSGTTAQTRIRGNSIGRAWLSTTTSARKRQGTPIRVTLARFEGRWKVNETASVTNTAAARRNAGHGYGVTIPLTISETQYTIWWMPAGG